MLVNKHSLNHSLKQQDKISPSRRSRTCSLIFRDYFANGAIEIAVSHAVAFEEDKTQIYWIVCWTSWVCVSHNIMIFQAPAQSLPSVTWELWSSWQAVIIPYPSNQGHATADLPICLLEQLACSLLWDCWGRLGELLDCSVSFGLLASYDSEAHSSSSVWQ